MKRYELIKEDLKQIIGKEGVNKFSVDVLEVLEALKDYEVDTIDEEVIVTEDDNSSLCELFDDNLNFSYVRCDNTYNYNGNISNDFDWVEYRHDENENYYVVIKFHRFGDIRGNYTSEMLLEFSSRAEWYEVLNECAYRFETAEGYDLTICALSEAIEVYNEYGDYITEVYGYYDSDEEIINDISEKIAE